MGVWSVGIVDSGVTNETEAVYGPNLYEYDFYYRNSDTDGWRTTSHGSDVAQSVEQTNGALERIDLQITSNSEYYLSTSAINNALSQIGTLHDSGWHIGAYNMSFGSPYSSWTSPFQAQIDALAGRGIFGVASSGNGGTAAGFENPTYPAGLSNVISVGSHDGSGNPSWFSQNSPSTVHVLADGENFPGVGDDGTSFAAPQVAATVTTVQALVEGVTSDRLSFGQTIDVLQLGGAGPQSEVDPANGATTYFLHTHQGSVDYALSTYVDPHFSGLEYIASFSDLEAAFGRDAGAARTHYIQAGVYEGRTVEFDGLEYVASHADLIGALGTNRAAAAAHYLDAGRAEGRTTTFDADNYMRANPDLATAFGGNDDLATRHYIANGFNEGRATTLTQQPVSEGATDLPRSTNTYGSVGVGQSVTGEIGQKGDRDWFRTELNTGEAVAIRIRGSSTGGGTLEDPYLQVRGAETGIRVADNDSGEGKDSYLVYTPTASDSHYIEVSGLFSGTGTYTIEVSRASNATLAELADGSSPFDPGKAPSSDDIQLTTLGPEPTYTDWIL
ncbi:S8/S53 family peptidase [Nisaea sp.]|uniref:S8/S53 family peptidase n=1 Tax=Nisaea sp. TaxID=2024842 RepID=UPI002B266C9F|nr:S8/S53 family peptidase [Nisaea sp.]